MGALFGFIAFWVAVFVLMGIYTLIRWIAENLPESGWFALIVCGIADFIDWCSKHVRHFFTVMFSNTKKFIYHCYTEGRKIHEQKGICRHS